MTPKEIFLRLCEIHRPLAQVKAKQGKVVLLNGLSISGGDGRPNGNYPFDPTKDWVMRPPPKLLLVFQEIARSGDAQAWTKAAVLHYSDCNQYSDPWLRGDTLIPHQIYAALEGKLLVQEGDKVYPKDCGDFASFCSTIPKNKDVAWR